MSSMVFVVRSRSPVDGTSILPSIEIRIAVVSRVEIYNYKEGGSYEEQDRSRINLGQRLLGAYNWHVKQSGR